MSWSFGLLRKAISHMLGKQEDDTGPADGLVEADGAIGIPRDTRVYEKILGLYFHIMVE